MSFVHLLIIKDDKLSLASVHYRSAIGFIEKLHKFKMPSHRFLDSGYVVVDFNRKLIVNGQDAFHLGRLVKDKKWYVFD